MSEAGGRVCRRLGRLKEAQAVVEQALELRPDEGVALALAAVIAADHGDVARARELLAAAASRAPGDPHVLLAEAEVAVQSGDANARAAVERAAEAARRHPFALLARDVERLAAASGDRAAP